MNHTIASITETQVRAELKLFLSSHFTKECTEVQIQKLFRIE